MLGPKRSILGCGEPVPRRVTFKSCAFDDVARVIPASNSKMLVHPECLLVAVFIRRISPFGFWKSIRFLWQPRTIANQVSR